jgi:hypothetical protein
MRHITVLAAVCIAVLLYVVTRVHLLSVEMNWLRSHLVQPPDAHIDGVDEFPLSERHDATTEGVGGEYVEVPSFDTDDASDEDEDDDADDRALEEIRKLSAVAAIVHTPTASSHDMRARIEEVTNAEDDASVELELDEGPPP